MDRSSNEGCSGDLSITTRHTTPLPRAIRGSTSEIVPTTMDKVTAELVRSVKCHFDETDGKRKLVKFEIHEEGDNFQLQIKFAQVSKVTPLKSRKRTQSDSSELCLVCSAGSSSPGSPVNGHIVDQTFFNSTPGLVDDHQTTEASSPSTLHECLLEDGEELDKSVDRVNKDFKIKFRELAKRVNNFLLHYVDSVNAGMHEDDSS